MVLFCDLTNMTVLSTPASERLIDDHMPGIYHVDRKPSQVIVLFWIQRPCYFCQVGFESTGKQRSEWKLRTNPGQVSAVTRLTNRSMQHCAGERGLFTESGGKALSAAHYQTTYALRHFLFICFTQQGVAKTKPFLSFHLFNPFLSCSLIILAGEGCLNSHIAKLLTT